MVLADAVDVEPGWGAWQPLEASHRTGSVPARPGWYRIRSGEQADLVYIGQSSNLRIRMGALKAVYGDQIPYNDPHTAAPCLWVLRTHFGMTFHVSVAPGPADPPARKALECVLVARHRQQFQRSPTANFGRMPEGWVKSSPNNAALVARGGRFRGFQSENAHRSPDHACVLDDQRPPTASDWAGLTWSPWGASLPLHSKHGVYRIRRNGQPQLVYIGQGRIRSRLAAHLHKGSSADHPQAVWFGGDLEWSWVVKPQAVSQQLLEIENDLIASHVLTVGQQPPAQFLG